ncbi:MAG TPA: GFA family protein [Acidimicrobiales bacterium]|nr:GFA family protein [Acidimicrobiales bacterium]
MERTATCACGRLEVRTRSEPAAVLTCHCAYCQRRTGSALQVSAVFSSDDDVTVTGASHVFNGLEQNGVATSAGDDVSYHFCPTCGSTVFWTFAGRSIVVIAAGCFADPAFPAPTAELHVPQRHRWMRPVEGAEQFEAFRPR